MSKKKRKWKLQGYDVMRKQRYALCYADGYSSEKKARMAAKKQLRRIEKRQPAKRFAPFQDRVYIVRPDGTRYRFLDRIHKKQAKVVY